MINTSTLTHGTRLYYIPLQITVELKYCITCPIYQRVSNAMQNPQDYSPEYEHDLTLQTSKNV